MTIMSYGAAPRAVARAAEGFAGFKADIERVQTQLASGRKATTYAGLGAAALGGLKLETSLSTLDAYASSVEQAGIRLGLVSHGLDHAVKLTSDLGSDIIASYQTPIGRKVTQLLANDGLAQLVDVLNTDVNGSYLYAGRKSDTKPVVSAELMLEGEPGRAGLRTLVAERSAADLGVAGLGRLTIANAGATTTLEEEAAGLPFGFKIAGISRTGTGLSVTNTAGPPASASVTVAAPPANGDKVSFVLTAPDGSRETITLVAGSSLEENDGTFAPGATNAATAANLAAALGTALATRAASVLPAASAFKAASDFFGGTAGSPPPRVGGPPFATATTNSAGTAANTIIWYAGDEASPADARGTAAVRISEDQTVGVGAQANEPAFRALLSTFAVLALQDPNAVLSPPYHAAFRDRAHGSLTFKNGGQTIEMVTTDFSLATATVKTGSARITATRNQLNELKEDIVGIDPNEVAMQLLATQTRLQASYQTTSSVLRLSLADFI
jgi:flagellin-like hook-associated protein FlgL